MKNQSSDEVFYSLNIEDIQTVAEDELDRKLTDIEIESVKDLIAANIDWYAAISNAISEKIKQ